MPRNVCFYWNRRKHECCDDFVQQRKQKVDNQSYLLLAQASIPPKYNFISCSPQNQRWLPLIMVTLVQPLISNISNYKIWHLCISFSIYSLLVGRASPFWLLSIRVDQIISTCLSHPNVELKKEKITIGRFQHFKNN